MKARLVLTLIVAAGALAAQGPAQAAPACEGQARPGAQSLTVNVMGVRAPEGQVAITIYPNDKKRFLAPGGKIMRLRTKARAPATSACFWLPPGSYAVAVYHDTNANKDFDRNAVGLPKEGFGFSNNPSTRLGLPSLESARFSVGPSGRSLQIEMQYLR